MTTMMSLNYITLIIFLGTSLSCGSKIIRVLSSEDLKDALLKASPGDNISLSGNTSYRGTFMAIQNGTRASPIAIFTENFKKSQAHFAKIVGEGSNSTSAALTIAGNYYNLDNISIANPLSMGLLIEGTDVSLEGVLIKNSEIAVRITGSRSYVKNCSISDVHSGIELEGDFGIVRDTFVTGKGIMSLVAEKDTCCGTLMGNVLEGKVDIKGTDFNLLDNLIEGKSK